MINNLSDDKIVNQSNHDAKNKNFDISIDVNNNGITYNNSINYIYNLNLFINILSLIIILAGLCLDSLLFSSFIYLLSIYLEILVLYDIKFNYDSSFDIKKEFDINYIKNKINYLLGNSIIIYTICLTTAYQAYRNLSDHKVMVDFPIYNFYSLLITVLFKIILYIYLMNSSGSLEIEELFILKIRNFTLTRIVIILIFFVNFIIFYVITLEKDKYIIDIDSIIGGFVLPLFILIYWYFILILELLSLAST